MFKKIIFWVIILFLITNCKNSKIEEKTLTNNNLLKSTIQEEKIQQILPKPKIKKISSFKFTRGLYLSAYTVVTKKFFTILDSAANAGINTIVFDLKNINGDIFFSIKGDEGIKNDNIKPFINISKVVNKLHRRNIRAVARLVMFHDQYLAENDTLLRPLMENGNVWKENRNGKPAWLDSSQPDVQKRLLDIIEQVAQQGVDEIQMDYVRFPTQGKLANAQFYFQKEDSYFAKVDSNYIKRCKSDIIQKFVEKAKNICEKYKVTLTGDIFAIVAWQRKVDVQNTGQDIRKITQYLDAIHPMIYSSHFSASFGYRKNIANEPYYIVYKATKLTQKYTNKKCKVIPYIQANSWKVNYKPSYIYAQIEAVKNLNADGYILWNASNKYLKTLRWIKKYNQISS